MRGKALAGLLGLLVVLVASAEEMGLRDFNATQVATSGHLPWGTGPPEGAWGILAAAQRTGPGGFLERCPVRGEGWPAGAPGAAPPLHVPPVFRPLVRDRLGFQPGATDPPQLKKMGAVLVEREGPYLTLTSVSDQ